MFIDLSILFTPEQLARKPQQQRSQNRQNAIFEAAGMTHPQLPIESTAQTVTNLTFNFYELLPNPDTSSEETYWEQHHLICQMAFRAIFRDPFCPPTYPKKMG